MLTKGICQRNLNHKFAFACQSSFSGAYFHILLIENQDHLWEVGVDDEEISIDGDQQDGEGGEEDAGGLRGAHHLADDLLVVMMIRVGQWPFGFFPCALRIVISFENSEYEQI